MDARQGETLPQAARALFWCMAENRTPLPGDSRGPLTIMDGCPSIPSRHRKAEHPARNRLTRIRQVTSAGGRLMDFALESSVPLHAARQ